MTDPLHAFLRGTTLMNQGRPADAEPFFREALRGDPNDGRTLEFLALAIFLQDDREEEALKVIGTALAADPENADALTLKARILEVLGRHKQGLEAVGRSLELRPSDAFAHAVRARLLLGAGRKDEAESDARQALRLDPDDHFAQLTLSACLRSQGRQAEDRQNALDILARDPLSEAAHINAGQAALSANDIPGAETHFLEALRLDASNRQARDGLKDAYRCRSRVFAAVTRLHHRIMVNSSTWNAILLVAYLALIAKGDDLARYLGGPMAGRVVNLLTLVLLALYMSHQHLGNLSLLADRRARLSLSPLERWVSLVVAALMAAGFAVKALSLQGVLFLDKLGLGLIGCGMVLGMVAPNESLAGRRLFAAGAAVLFAVWLVLALSLGWCPGLAPKAVVVWLLLKGHLLLLPFLLMAISDRFKR